MLLSWWVTPQFTTCFYQAALANKQHGVTITSIYFCWFIDLWLSLIHTHSEHGLNTHTVDVGVAVEEDWHSQQNLKVASKANS